MSAGRTLVVGDVHGCLGELDERPLDDGLVPKDEELVRRHLEQKDKHDAE